MAYVVPVIMDANPGNKRWRAQRFKKDKFIFGLCLQNSIARCQQIGAHGQLPRNMLEGLLWVAYTSVVSLE